MPTHKHFRHKLAFIGAGYVGLVSGTCLSDIGHKVILVDRKQETVDKLRRGLVPIYEPGLDTLIKKNVKAGRLSFTTDLAKAVQESDIIFIAVQTPPDKDGHADLSYVEGAATQIAQAADAYKIVVNKSTVPPTTGDFVAKILAKHNKKKIDFDVVSNPEFLREGSAIEDFMTGDRHVIGVSNKRAEKVMREIYAPLPMQLFVTDVKSAELIKYASNSFLATKISFINAVAQICELTGGNIDDVAKGIGMDKRIGSSFLKAGVGYGGSCFPKDVSAFVKIAEKHGYDFNLLKDTESVNKEARNFFIKKITNAVGGKKGKTLAMWGLAFKPNTDDMREAPSITVVESLKKKGFKIQAYDPEATETAKFVLGDKVSYEKDMYDALKGADALVIMTEWKEFETPDWDKVTKLLKDPVIIDGRNMFKPAEMEKLGFVYHSIGRG
ncbi:MAG: UDP-glucose/GDP-mannose dehydrogenase family protein [Candidatus Andersenbacteria bacterium]|nr:UDP-glucose/GDP-mannose dehydrogenase family protein [Candidatus Andersenbacteria bacterium]MBI3251005.1 UDP-glucose/GDP-mannose dehydrogenase family protein [Candidatus Andersenbacteria bacterium]